MIRKKKPLVRLDLTAAVGHERESFNTFSWAWVGYVVIAILAVWLIWFGLS